MDNVAQGHASDRSGDDDEGDEDEDEDEDEDGDEYESERESQGSSAENDVDDGEEDDGPDKDVDGSGGHDGQATEAKHREEHEVASATTGRREARGGDVAEAVHKTREPSASTQVASHRVEEDDSRSDESAALTHKDRGGDVRASVSDPPRSSGSPNSKHSGHPCPVRRGSRTVPRDPRMI